MSKKLSLMVCAILLSVMSTSAALAEDAETTDTTTATEVEATTTTSVEVETTAVESEEETTMEEDTTMEEEVAADDTAMEESAEDDSSAGRFQRPEGWATMTREEKLKFLADNGVQVKALVQAKLQERRENAQEYMTHVFEENEIEQPENWTEMTREEKAAFLTDNGIDFDREELKDMIRANVNARKAARFQRLQKIGEEVKTFLDENNITRAEAVKYLQEHGIINGYGDGSFKPENGISRAEAIKIVLEAIGEDPADVALSSFSDVESGAWYKGYIEKAKNNGWVKGYEDGTFKPNQTVNKAELMKIAFEIMGVDASAYASGTLEAYVDPTEWYAGYLEYAVDTGLVDLDEDGNPVAGENMTREEFSEFVYRLILQQEAL